jgi:hypothetical protein
MQELRTFDTRAFTDGASTHATTPSSELLWSTADEPSSCLPHLACPKEIREDGLFESNNSKIVAVCQLSTICDRRLESR